MKKALLITCLSIGSLAGNAQKIEIGLNSGASFYKDGGTPQKPGYYGSLRGQLNLKGWQVGAAADLLQSHYTSRYVYTSIFPSTQEVTLERQRLFRYITPNVFANKVFHTKIGYWYAGVNLGWSFVTRQVKDENNIVTSTRKSSAFLGGVQAGYTLFVTKHIGINAEAGGRWLDGRNSAFLFPVSAGVRYRL